MTESKGPDAVFCSCGHSARQHGHNIFGHYGECNAAILPAKLDEPMGVCLCGRYDGPAPCIEHRKECPSCGEHWRLVAFAEGKSITPAEARTLLARAEREGFIYESP